MYQDIEDLYKACMNCKKCKLCTNRTNMVFDDGDLGSNLMFIGERTSGQMKMLQEYHL